MIALKTLNPTTNHSPDTPLSASLNTLHSVSSSHRDPFGARGEALNLTSAEEIKD
jgi:hypothetical protein